MIKPYIDVDELKKMEAEILHGTMTNEEWFCNLSTEEKARFLDSNGMRYCECGCKACVISEQCKSGGIRKTQKEMWIEWLKEKHE